MLSKSAQIVIAKCARSAFAWLTVECCNEIRMINSETTGKTQCFNDLEACALYRIRTFRGKTSIEKFIIQQIFKATNIAHSKRLNSPPTLTFIHQLLLSITKSLYATTPPRRNVLQTISRARQFYDHIFNKTLVNKHRA